MSLKWWEKTVEYNFVMSLASQNNLFLSPLDGDHEKAGDAILRMSELWVMIEFKKDLDTVGSEKIKFGDGNYEKAKKALRGHDKHHHIIYGVLNTNIGDKPCLGLDYQTYFSEEKSNNLNELLSSGKTIKEFSEYLKKFTDFKKKSSSGSGGMIVEDYMMVAGVTSSGQVVECISMSEFRREHKLELELKREVTKSRGPSMG